MEHNYGMKVTLCCTFTLRPIAKLYTQSIVN